MAEVIERSWRLLAAANLQSRVRDSINERIREPRAKLYDRLLPRLTEWELLNQLQRDALEDLRSELRKLGVALEREVRQHRELPDLLSSHDVRWALSEMRQRIEFLASALRSGTVRPSELSAFIVSVRALGIGDIRSAKSSDEVADAISRTVDHLHSFMLAHHFVRSRQPADGFTAADVRRVRAHASAARLRAWQGRLSELSDLSSSTPMPAAAAIDAEPSEFVLAA